MPNSNDRQNSGSTAKSLATFGFGALLGAAGKKADNFFRFIFIDEKYLQIFIYLFLIFNFSAAGAAWYFSQDEEQSQQRHQQQRQHFYSQNHPASDQHHNVPRAQNDTEKEDDEKDGTVKVCEVCFVSFAELKECNVQIVATPCGHIYCRDCICSALSVKSECPHCRTEVRVHDLRRLFL